MRPVALVLLALIGALAPPLVSAQGLSAPAPGLAAAGRAWQAVGRLEIGQTGFCTVTLVAPDRALTAAHCLVDPRTGVPHRPDEIVVHLGYANGRAEVTRGVRAVALAAPPAAAGGPEAVLGQVARDLALITLDRPVRRAGLAPIALAPPGAGLPHRLTVVSYARGRDQRAAVQDDCLLIATRSDGALVLDCQVDHGASGAPVMDRSGGEAPRIVAVISARGRMAQPGLPEADVALAAPVHGPDGAGFAPAPQPPGGGVVVRRAGAAQAPAAAGPRVLRVAPPAEPALR